MQIDSRAATTLTDCCRLAMRLFAEARTFEAAGWRETHTVHWRELILDRVELALRPWLDSGSSDPDEIAVRRSRHLVKEARRHLENTEYAKSANIDDLAESLGVSPRSLFLAFRNELGVGPRRFSELVRLNVLRTRLYRNRASETTVTSIANEVGFSELGRTAAIYKKLFGEKPSETLARI